MAPQSPTQSGSHTTELRSLGEQLQENTNPQHPTVFHRFPEQLCNAEEAHEKEPIDLATAWDELSTELKIFLIVRCVMTFLCFVAIIGMFVGIGRSRRFRYKSWRLYMFTAIMVMTWMCLALYYGNTLKH